MQQIQQKLSQMVSRAFEQFDPDTGLTFGDEIISLVEAEDNLNAFIDKKAAIIEQLRALSIEFESTIDILNASKDPDYKVDFCGRNPRNNRRGYDSSKRDTDYENLINNLAGFGDMYLFEDDHYTLKKLVSAEILDVPSFVETLTEELSNLTDTNWQVLDKNTFDPAVLILSNGEKRFAITTYIDSNWFCPVETYKQFPLFSVPVDPKCENFEDILALSKLAYTYCDAEQLTKANPLYDEIPELAEAVDNALAPFSDFDKSTEKEQERY